MANLEELKAKITSELDADFVDIFDDSDGCGQKLVITVVSNKFQGVSMIQQHRMVNKVSYTSDNILLCK
jgi:BolA-like protein 3